MFEVFQDVTPLPARTFVNRCRLGTTATLHGSQVHKVLSGLGIYFGRTSRCAHVADLRGVGVLCLTSGADTVVS